MTIIECECELWAVTAVPTHLLELRLSFDAVWAGDPDSAASRMRHLRAHPSRALQQVHIGHDLGFESLVHTGT